MRTVCIKAIHLLIVLVCVLFLGGVLHAHDSHDKEIHRLDHLLQQPDSTSPEVLQALLRRADLHRREQSWKAALADYEKVASIQQDNPGMLLGITQLYLDQNNFQAASRWSAQLLEQDSNHIQALLLHARTQRGLGKVRLVPELYSRAIELMENPNPEHYLEHAHAVFQSQSDSAVGEAIAIVDTGAQKLNHPVSLHSFALEQELQTEQHTAALARIDRVTALYPRLWPWHLKKAELLISIHRVDEACVVLQMLENDIGQLPPQRSRTQAMQTISASVIELQSDCANAASE